MYNKTSIETAKDFTLVEAALEFPSLPDGTSFDLRNVITDIDIFEHIDKPYLTGNVVLLDSLNLYSSPGFFGIERLTLQFSLPYTGAKTITKVFYVDKVVKNIRTSDHTVVLSLHLIEDIGYLSEFNNVNKPYQGRLYDIVQQMFTEYFSKQVVAGQTTTIADKDAQPPVKVIVPNLSPLQAADWVKDRMTTTGGFPFYLFSTLVSSKIYLLSLAKMLEQVPATNQPFVYSRTFSNTANMPVEQQALIIESYKEHEHVDLLKLNAMGFVNSKYSFHDMTTGTTTQAGNQRPDLTNWTAHSMYKIDDPYPNQFGTNQTKKTLYPSDAKLPQTLGQEPQPLHTRSPSSSTSFVHTSAIYDDGLLHLGEANNRVQYKQIIDSKALRRWLVNQAVDVRVSGMWFLTGQAHNTIGNKIAMQFLVANGESMAIDKKKSGDYLIYAARHQFTREGYDVTLTGVKVKDRTDQTSVEPTVAL